MKKFVFVSLIFLTIWFISASEGYSRNRAPTNDEHLPGADGFFKPSRNESPNIQTCTHRANNMWLTVSNFSALGSMNQSYRDCETGLSAPSCEFPGGSLLDYLYAAGLWVGAVVGNDTLVSTGWDGWGYNNEMWPCSGPECVLTKRSSNPLSDYYSPDARSDFEYIAKYTDTLVDQRWTEMDWTGRPHIPLGLEIRQTSYSWAVDYAQDFILIDYSLKNMGPNKLKRVYIGLQVDGDVSHRSRERGAWTDDICGFRQSWPSQVCPGYIDTIAVAWIADNDGDQLNGVFDDRSVTSVTGVKIMRKPDRDTKISFNWWTSNSSSRFDWGPMLSATRRDFGTGGLGTPMGDNNKYYMLSNGEDDYDQTFAAVDFSDRGWLSPSQSTSMQVAEGGDTRYLLSMGPFDIDPGDSLPLTIGYIAGEHLHTSPTAFRDYMSQRYDPDGFYSTFDFSDLAENAVWADWIYDNPGVDTDGDGDYGDFCEVEDTLPNGEIVIDSVYYRGDGVPDFRAATAPPPPEIRARTEVGRVILRWNGMVTETFVDPFTKLRDFEGYQVLLNSLRRVTNLSLLESRDFVNYKRSYWDRNQAEWVVADEMPLQLDSLKALYGSDFNPDDYPPNSAGTGYEDNGLAYSFEAVGWNQSIDGWEDGARSILPGGIHKRFADEIARGEVTSDPDSTIEENWTWDYDPLSGDSTRYQKYYEYEYVIDNLLSSVPWYVSVSAFDFGDFKNDIAPLYSSPLSNMIEVWAINDAAAVLDQKLDIVAYPNPYYGDGRYIRSHYEDREGTGFIDHSRRIHFVNLPPECRITIYTLDGDLVRRLEHPGPFSDADSKIEWDLRSRNNELVSSGIYLFVVESKFGNQIGKLVLIL